MIKVLFLLSISFFLPSQSFAQEEIIIGNMTKEALKNNPNFEWFNTNYEEYKAQPEQIELISKILKDNDYNIVVYFGTWCEDSQRELPGFIKILDQSKFDYTRLKLIAIPESKDIPDVTEEESKRLNIFNVPTIIVYEKGTEINRFVEYPQETLEKDLIKILSKKPYKHSYY